MEVPIWAIWSTVGFVLGLMVRFLMPRPPMLLASIVLGMLGAVLGAFLGSELWGLGGREFSVEGLAAATTGSFALLLAYTMILQ